MELIDKLVEDKMRAMVDKDGIKKNLLSCLIGDAQKNVIKPAKPSKETILGLIKKFIENAQFVMSKTEALNPAYTQAVAEIDILEDYRTQYGPKQLTEKDIECIILCKSLDFKGTMKYFKENYPSQYEGK